MSGSHEKLPGLFWVQLVLVAIVATLFVYYSFNPGSEGHGAEGVTHEVSESSKQALKPIGEVAVNNASGKAVGGTERSGEEIVNKTCQVCHKMGVANAPKMDESGKANWQERFAKGIDQMVATAKTGKGAMPPMGTDPTLSDAELKNAILYMLDKAGVDVSSVSTDTAAEGNAGNSEAVSAEATTDEAKDTAANDTEVNKLAETPTTEQATTESVAPSAPAAPAAPEPPEPEVTDATDDTTSAAAEESASEPAPTASDTASTEVAPAATATQASATVATVEAPVAEEKQAIDGGKIYQELCFACHGTGAAGAPRLDDKAAWAPRVAQGKEVLYHFAINGKTSPAGVMPPKGGNMSLSDDEVKAAVDYIVSQVQ